MARNCGFFINSQNLSQSNFFCISLYFPSSWKVSIQTNEYLQELIHLTYLDLIMLTTKSLRETKLFLSTFRDKYCFYFYSCRHVSDFVNRLGFHITEYQALKYIVFISAQKWQACCLTIFLKRLGIIHTYTYIYSSAQI